MPSKRCVANTLAHTPLQAQSWRPRGCADVSASTATRRLNCLNCNVIRYDIKKIAETMDALVPTPATTTNATVPVIERVAAAAVPGEEEGVAAAAAPGEEEGATTPAPERVAAASEEMAATMVRVVLVPKRVPAAAAPGEEEGVTAPAPERVAATAAPGEMRTRRRGHNNHPEDEVRMRRRG